MIASSAVAFASLLVAEEVKEEPAAQEMKQVTMDSW
jgi:hypothetical protein